MGAATCAAGNITALPFVPAPRKYRGCMGRIVPGVPLVPGAYKENPECVFSWLLQQYPRSWQSVILADFADYGDEDYLLSWPDFRRDTGLGPAEFGQQCLQVRGWGMRPAVMLCSKDVDGHSMLEVINAIDPVIPYLKAAGVSRICLGWELSLWLSPFDVQGLINYYAPQLQAWGCLFYVHFQQGYGAFQYPGEIFANFWNRNQNKLRGVWHQKIMWQTTEEYLTGEGGLRDILRHFNGGNFCTPDSGDGTPFDLVAFELDIDKLGRNQITETQMHRIGEAAIALPGEVGPTGPVSVMGSGCGQ